MNEKQIQNIEVICSVLHSLRDYQWAERLPETRNFKENLLVLLSLKIAEIMKKKKQNLFKLKEGWCTIW